MNLLVKNSITEVFAQLNNDGLNLREVDKLQGMFPHNVDERYDQAKEVWRNDMRGGGNGEGCFIQ